MTQKIAAVMVLAVALSSVFMSIIIVFLLPRLLHGCAILPLEHNMSMDFPCHRNTDIVTETEFSNTWQR
jgi:hypothetical protein